MTSTAPLGGGRGGALVFACCHERHLLCGVGERGLHRAARYSGADWRTPHACLVLTIHAWYSHACLVLPCMHGTFGFVSKSAPTPGRVRLSDVYEDVTALAPPGQPGRLPEPLKRKAGIEN